MRSSTISHVTTQMSPVFTSEGGTFHIILNVHAEIISNLKKKKYINEIDFNLCNDKNKIPFCVGKWFVAAVNGHPRHADSSALSSALGFYSFDYQGNSSSGQFHRTKAKFR